MKKRIITVELSCTYTFDEKDYPVSEYDDEDIAEIACEWFLECNPHIYMVKEKND